MKNKRILITGGAGFIPSRVTRRLYEKGAKTAILTQYKSLIDNQRIADLWENIEVIEADIRNQDSLTQVAKFKPDIIVHMAAYNHVGDSFLSVQEALDVNCKGTANVVEAYQDYEKLIYISTSEIYGFQTEVPFRETMTPHPISPYSIGKYAGELYCQMKMTMMKKPIVIIRPFNTYGPYQSSKAVIGEMIETLLKNKPVYATEGIQTREFNYVDDIANGIILAIENDEAVGNIINIGNGQEVPIKDLIFLLKELTNSKSEIHLGALQYRPTEIWRMCACNERAKRILKWEPKVTLREGLTKTIEWYKEFFKVENNKI